MISTTTLTLVDGVRIVVPDSLDLMTPYVLQEQQDWFEDEIKFLRRLLQPGMKVIDIGANYGVYTLSMAKAVGAAGRVWAFEPATSTAQLLAAGISANGFSQVVLEQSALSSICGTAQLSLNDNSELNALVHDQSSPCTSETVPLVTLDECLQRHNWADIEFMKIDAEGEELNILQGGTRFFSELSPLVQYEIKAGDKVHLELVQHFSAMGYDSYRLVPGLDLLVPFDARSTSEGYMLNLFCCKKDRAEHLTAQGFLLESTVPLTVSGIPLESAVTETIKAHAGCDWRDTIGKLPYGTELADSWEQTVALGDSGEVEGALSLYILSRDSSLSLAERFAALDSSFIRLKTICEHDSSYLRQASLARVARDYGARLIAVQSLLQLTESILQHNEVDPNEPFLAPQARFDVLPPGEIMGNWVLAAVLEAFEQLAYYSSFFAGPSALPRLKLIRTLGFGNAEMGRRLSLLQQRFEQPVQ